MLTPVSADAPGHESVGTRKAASSSRSAAVKGPRKNLIGGATKCRACGPRAMPVVYMYPTQALPCASPVLACRNCAMCVDISLYVIGSCGTARSTLPMEFASGCAAVKFWSIGRFGAGVALT